MKNVLFLFFSILTISGKAQTADAALLQAFLNSPDYQSFLSGSPFARTGTADLKQSFVSYNTYSNNGIEKEIPVIYIQFSGIINGKKIITGQIQAIKVKDDYTGLPGNGRYLMLYKDLRQFNSENGTGIIKVYDLNYDGYLAGEAEVGSGTVSKYVPFPVPDQVAAKYNLTGRSSLPCTNITGNTTFGECFSCMIGSCVLNPDCRSLCLVANLLQWQCTRTMLVYCSMLALAS